MNQTTSKTENQAVVQPPNITGAGALNEPSSPSKSYIAAEATSKRDGLVGQAKRPYDDDDYGIAPKKISYEEALELSKQQQGLVSVLSMVQVLVFCMFLCGFVGFVKAYNLIKAAPELAQGAAARLLELTGPLISMGTMGAALWFMLSSLVGGLALIIPMAIYNKIARSEDRSGGKNAGLTFYDVIRAEILKYALMIIVLTIAFKFTSLNALVIMATFVVIMFVQIIKSALNR